MIIFIPIFVSILLAHTTDVSAQYNENNYENIENCPSEIPECAGKIQNIKTSSSNQIIGNITVIIIGLVICSVLFIMFYRKKKQNITRE